MFLGEILAEANKPNTFARLFMKSGMILEGHQIIVPPPPIASSGMYISYVSTVSSDSFYFRDKRYGEMWINPTAVEAYQTVNNLQMLEQKAAEKHG